MASKIFMYLLAIFLGVMFALYLSAAVGWTFVYVFVCAPIFSFLVTLWLHKRKSVSLKLDVNRTMLYKKETVTLRITAANKSFFPVPAVKVFLSVPEGLEPESPAKSFVMSIPPRSEATAEIVYSAKVWGCCTVGAKTAELHDFLDFFKFRIPLGENAELLREVKVFPDIPEMAGDAPLLRSAAENAKLADDSEETRETDNANLFAGMPGYTHREYVEGDPVRRINWKLSSKRDKYMVRLDDEIESIQQNIVLDSRGGSDVYENERAVEGVLAAALGLLKCGFESTVYCRFKGVWESFSVTEPADVSALQTRLADFRFAEEHERCGRLPAEELSEKGSGAGVLLFTSMFDKSLTAEISSAEEQGIFTAVISADSVSVGSAFQIWRLNEDYSAELISQ
ncbi:MAG: DUF58 domain-containing protein [Ruminococcus sp.]|nr:DUF58 domain-containing protein [Ruminococcus sp.]